MYLELYFWILSGDCGNCCVLKKIFSNSGMVGRRKLPDPSMNNILGWFCPEVPCYNNAKRPVVKIQD